MRSVFLGYCVLDRSQFRRRTRAFAGWTVVTAMVFIVHIWAYMYQKCVVSTKSKCIRVQGGHRDYTRVTVTLITKIDFKDSAYAAHGWLYIFCGLLDAMWQTFVYWLLGSSETCSVHWVL